MTGFLIYALFSLQMHKGTGFAEEGIFAATSHVKIHLEFRAGKNFEYHC